MDAAVAREGDAIDEESLKQTTTPAAEEAQEAVGVGVLGWLGFIIVNLAAWGFITFASFVSWTFGLGVCVLYTVLLVGLAVWLERRGPVYKQFVNLLWVLAGWFLFISGGYIAINALGDDSWSGTRNVNYPLNPVDFDQDLPSLVPAASSPGLQQWASQLYRSSDGPSFISFGGVVFFNGRSPGNSERLHYTDGTTIAQVEPEISFATNFRVVGTTLYFMASNRLYRMPAGDLTGAVGISLEGKGGGFFQDLYVENSTSLLYFKARLDCTATCAGSQAAHTSVLSIFTLDETAGNPTITDLRGDTCVLWAAQVTCPLGGGSNVIPGPTRTVLWGIIFLAAVPMLILSVYALLWKQMPGLVFNIFGGIQAIAIMVYFLINYDSTPEGGTSGPAAVYGDRFMDFMKWFTLIYTSVLWKALVSWSLITPTAAPWLEEVKTWWAAVVGTAFFVNIHVVLQVPFTTEIWPWVVYALLALLQMLMSAVVQRTVPMVMGALGAFVVAWKIGFEVSEALQFGSREVQYLTTFAIIGLEGVGIILAAIAFARNRDKVQDWVRGLLCCGPCQKKTQPED